MNKKDSREVVRWQAKMWEDNEREAMEEQEGLDISSCKHEMLYQRTQQYCSMKHAVLMCAEALKLITQEECDRCMKDGVSSVLKSPWDEKAGGGTDAGDLQQHNLPEVQEDCP